MDYLSDFLPTTELHIAMLLLTAHSITEHWVHNAFTLIFPDAHVSLQHLLILVFQLTHPRYSCDTAISDYK